MSGELKRYDIVSTKVITEIHSTKGPWVKYEDHCREIMILNDEVDYSHAEIVHLKAKIKELE